MPEVREVSREDAEKIWACKCPVCGGNLKGVLDKSGGTVSMKVICEYGCKKFSVPPRPDLPRWIRS